jgi:hypothetical protein
MEIWNWYYQLMGNNFVLVLGVVFSVIAFTWWGKREEKWKSENKYGTGKKIIKVIGIALIAVFGLPGMIIFFGSWV